MTDDRIAYDPEKIIATLAHMNADAEEISERLAGTKIPNSRVVVALMMIASTVSERDQDSKEAFRATLMFLAGMAIVEAEEAGC
jgi:hypothetical protein